MTNEQKQIIDNMTQYELCKRWRFAEVGDPLFQDDTGKYYAQKLKEKGGFTPEISKKLGF